MGRCRHRVVCASFWLSGEWVVLPRDYPRADKRRCTKCGEWLPIGPANDSDERVRVEIRAAELAAGFDARRDRWNGRDHLEWLGASCHRQGFSTLDDAPCLAGYLARQIATHPKRDEGDL